MITQICGDEETPHKVTKEALLKAYPRDSTLLQKLDQERKQHYWMSDWESFVRDLWEPLGEAEGGQGLKKMLVSMVNRLKRLKEREGEPHSLPRSSPFKDWSSHVTLSPHVLLQRSGNDLSQKLSISTIMWPN